MARMIIIIIITIIPFPYCTAFQLDLKRVQILLTKHFFFSFPSQKLSEYTALLFSALEYI
jgi:hypothetical protein